jgi:predicted RNA-binding Zn-ribbon protein involved in translation (DUF1610 family)
MKEKEKTMELVTQPKEASLEEQGVEEVEVVEKLEQKTNSKRVYIPSSQERDQGLVSGRFNCPKCQRLMTYFKVRLNKRNEFYCEDCHFSVPVFVD